jgi:hypothetical protein
MHEPAPPPSWPAIVNQVGVGVNLIAALLELGLGQYALMGVSAAVAVTCAAIFETLRRTAVEHALRIRRLQADAAAADHAAAMLARQRAYLDREFTADATIGGPRH